MPFQKPIRVRSQDNKANVKDEKVEKSCPAECQRGVLRAARMMLLLSLLKHLVPSYLYLEIDEISQAIVPLKFKGPKCWKIHFLMFRFQISSMERGGGGGHTHASNPPYKERAYTRPMRPPNPKPPTFKIQVAYNLCAPSVFPGLLRPCAWSCCEEEGREEVSRDVTDSGSNTFSRSSNGCSIASIKLYCRNWLFLIKNFTTFCKGIFGGRVSLRYSLNSHCFEGYPHCHNRTRTLFSSLILNSNSSKRITCTKISSIDRKQSETVYDCVSISLFLRFCIATRRQQDVTIEKFLSLASCLRSSAIIGDHRRLVGNEHKRCFHLRELFVTKLSESACDCLRRSYAHI